MPEGGATDEVLSRCGYRCDLCLASRPSMEEDPSRAQLLSEGRHEYFGFRVPAGQTLRSSKGRRSKDLGHCCSLAVAVLRSVGRPLLEN